MGRVTLLLATARAQGIVLASALFLGGIAQADELERVPPLSTKIYRESCGECHFAYFPGLLPASAWRRLMSRQALADHFGENAELDESERQAILAWLVRHAAPERPDLQPEGAPRITNAPWFRAEHRGAERALADPTVRGKVKSLADCAACHTQAAKGDFEAVRIPGARGRFGEEGEEDEREEHDGWRRFWDWD